MSPSTTFIVLVGIAGSLITIYEFINSRIGSYPKRSRQLAFVFGAVTLAFMLASIIFANVLSPLLATGPGIAPTQSITTPQSGTGVTPTPTQVSSTQVPSPIPSPTPTSPPRAGTVLYQADWSTGLNGWSGDAQWTTLDGMLVSDGSGHHDPSISIVNVAAIAPYQPGTILDYAVEARIQLLNCSGCGFGLVVREGSYNGSENGYIGGLDSVNSNQPFSGLADIHTDTAQSCLSCGTAPLSYVMYTAGSNWHTYRVEVKGENIKFLIDGALVVEVNNTRFLSGGRVGIDDYGSQINVSSFGVVAL